MHVYRQMRHFPGNMGSCPVKPHICSIQNHFSHKKIKLHKNNKLTYFQPTAMDGHVWPGAKRSFSCCCLAYDSFPLIKTRFDTTRCDQKESWERNGSGLWHCGCYWQKNHKGQAEVRSLKVSLNTFLHYHLNVRHFNWYHLRGSKRAFLCELTEELSWPGQSGCWWSPKALLKTPTRTNTVRPRTEPVHTW